MNGDAPLQLHDVRPEHQRTHELLEQILARLPASDAERRAAMLAPIVSVVGAEDFTLASVFAFIEGAGAAGEPLRKALADLSPKAAGRLFAKWASLPAIVRVGESRAGTVWRIVGCDFENGKSHALKRERLGEW